MTQTILNVDLSQAELRCMAVFSEDQWMINALQEGAGDFFDTHLMPIAFPWIITEYGTVEAYKVAMPVHHKEDRTKVKAVQYGLAFGRQANAIAQALKMPVRDAQQIIDNYLSTAFDFARWRQDVMEAAITPSKRELLINPFGRKFQSEVITSKNKNNIQREALSFLPQSTSSDIMLATMIRILPDIKDVGGKLVNLVHDAAMVVCDKEYADTLGRYIGVELRRTGEMVLGSAVPMLSDYSEGSSWADLS